MEYTKIIITGATSGVGELLARKLATKENFLVITGRNEEKLKALDIELAPFCKKLIAFPSELSKPWCVDFFANLFAENTTVLINCAADFGPTKNLLDVSNEEILSGFNTNVLAPVSLTRRVLPFMIEKNYGRVINVGSTSGLTGYPLRAPYCLSKHALVAFTKTLNGEIHGGEYGKASDVKAFCICPGPIKGERIQKQILARAQYKNSPLEVTQKKFESILGRMLEPEEVVEKIIALLLPSDNSKVEDVITF